jgi:hypothetical protein
MINFSRKVINKNVKQKRSNVKPCGTPDNTRKVEENFPKIRKKEDLFDK